MTAKRLVFQPSADNTAQVNGIHGKHKPLAVARKESEKLVHG